MFRAILVKSMRSATCLLTILAGSAALAAQSDRVVGRGAVWIADAAANRVFELGRDGTVTREYRAFDVRDVDRLAGGHLLLTERSLHRVTEIDESGSVVWSFEALRSPCDADRLANGHTLIAMKKLE